MLPNANKYTADFQKLHYPSNNHTQVISNNKTYRIRNGFFLSIFYVDSEIDNSIYSSYNTDTWFFISCFESENKWQYSYAQFKYNAKPFKKGIVIFIDKSYLISNTISLPIDPINPQNFSDSVTKNKTIEPSEISDTSIVDSINIFLKNHNKHPFQDFYIHEFAYKICQLFFRYINNKFLEKEFYIIEKDRLIIENIKDKFLKNTTQSCPNIKHLSKLANMSESKFKRLFVKLYDKTPLEFQRDLRLHEGRELLKTKMFTVSEVAYQMGYKYDFKFIEAFRKKYSITPKAFMKSLI